MFSQFIPVLTMALLALISLLTIGLIFARLYVRATKERSFVRTGLGGQKVIKDGGALVLPILHDIIWVNMNTLRLEVRRAAEQALITKDRMRVDVTAEFYVRLKPDENAIATAAQTLGDRTMQPDSLKTLVEGKFVDALRAVAAGMVMEELHENRVEFVQQVQHTVAEDLNKNGLELESVSLTGLDQTAREHFNPDNAFDAEGLTKLTQAIEERRKKRNDIEQETRIQIEMKNLESEKQSLTIAQDGEFAKLEQAREVENRRAQQQAEIARVAAEKRRESEEADILSAREVEIARIEMERATSEKGIEKEKVVREKEIEKDRLIQEREIEKEKTIELANQTRDIAISEKSQEQSRASAEADRTRAEAVREEENVVTVKTKAVAERAKEITLIKAREAAEEQAINVTVAADAEKQAAMDKAEAVRIESAAEAEAVTMNYQAESDGTAKLNEAKNLLSASQINLAVNLALIERLPEIIRESVKPAENIDSIKIFDVNGLGGITGNTGVAANDGDAVAGGGNLADNLVGAMLKYQMMSPLAQQVMKEAGLDGVDAQSLLSGDASGLLKPTTPAAE